MRSPFLQSLRGVAVAVLAPALVGQTAIPPRIARAKLHPFLLAKLAAAEPGDRLPVYFVMRDKLRYSDFTPRILRMDKARRRDTVVAELRAHMRRTQRELATVLERSGDVEIVSRNWLGNFVRVEATPAAIHAGAAVAGVAEVWYDAVHPLALLEDDGPVASAPGNGPLDTRADRVWARGIRGEGIVWMNADSGVRASATDINDVHPGLIGRLWTNPGETFDNAVDDDGNGKVDDYYGWDFGNDERDLDDIGGHGTRTTGVFVAVDHRTGDVYGNSPDARIMIGQIDSESAQWDSLQYAITMGAHGHSSSHSFKNLDPPPNYRMHRDVAETTLAAGLIRTNSTSNNGNLCFAASTVARPFNISAPGNVPAPWLHPDQTLVGGVGGVLGVGSHHAGSFPISQPGTSPCGPFAWDLQDLLAVLPGFPAASWSARHDDYPWRDGAQLGLLKPDITGPAGTMTCEAGSAYGPFAGTSNATPGVASCLALALSANPSLTPEDLAMAVQTTAFDYGPKGKDIRSGAGKVDAWELTKMARALHRVNGDVAHTIDISTAAGGFCDLELDSIPNRRILLLIGDGPDAVTQGELTVRVSNPVISLHASTNSQGNYVLRIPVFPALAGLDAWTQFVVGDRDFGPSGSNAIRVRFLR